MIRWSEIPMECHVLRFEQLYTEKPEDANFVTANVTTYLHTAYDALNKDTIDRTVTLCFQYDHQENKSARPRVFDNRERFVKDELYQSFRYSFPQPSDIDSVDHVSSVLYVYPSSNFNDEKSESSYYYEKDKSGRFSHHCFYANTVITEEGDSIGNRTKPYVNKLEIHALSKGCAKSIESTFTYNRSSGSFWKKLKWLVMAKDLSRTNYCFYFQTSSIDSINLSVRFEEPSEVHGLGGDHVEQSPYFFNICKSFSEKEKNSVFYFHARHLESENVQAMRMFFISSIGAVFLGFFIASLLSVVGALFLFFYCK